MGGRCTLVSKVAAVFRLHTDGARPMLVDISISGTWMAPAQRDQFRAVLAQNNGDIKAFSAHLRVAEKQYLQPRGGSRSCMLKFAGTASTSSTLGCNTRVERFGSAHT